MTVYDCEDVIPFNGFPEGTELNILPKLRNAQIVPPPNATPEGIMVKVASEFCSKEIQFDFVSNDSCLEVFVQHYLDVGYTRTCSRQVHS